MIFYDFFCADFMIFLCSLRLLHATRVLAAVVMTHAKNRLAADSNPEAWEEGGVYRLTQSSRIWLLVSDL